MAVAVTNITGGPAQITVGGSEVSHTQGGVTVRVAPQQRMRVVDKYGSTPIEVIHAGDECRIVAPFAEWTMDVLEAVYSAGKDGTTYQGVGRTAGYIYSKVAVVVIPFLTADANKKSEFPKCVPVGQIEIVHNNEDDRVFNAEFVACADPSNTDGELIGKIHVTSAE